jgi:hypothetical protein
VPCSKDLLRAFTLVLIPSGQADYDTACLEMRCIFLDHFPVRHVVDRPDQTALQSVVQT